MVIKCWMALVPPERRPASWPLPCEMVQTGGSWEGVRGFPASCWNETGHGQADSAPWRDSTRCLWLACSRSETGRCPWPTLWETLKVTPQTQQRRQGGDSRREPAMLRTQTVQTALLPWNVLGVGHVPGHKAQYPPPQEHYGVIRR